MKAQHINFTEKAIANLPIPKKEDGQQVYYDNGCTDGLMLIVTYGGTKTYYFFMLFQGRPVRVKLGRFGDIKVVDVRAEAHTLRERATKGEDPTAKRREELNDITFKQFYEGVYKPEYSVIYKRRRSIDNDNSIFNHRLNIFHNRKLLTIKPEEIEKLHDKTKQELSTYTANRALSLIKHMYTIAIKHKYIPNRENPAEFIKKFPELSRDRFLQSDELNRLLNALNSEENEVFKGYIMLSLFTGLRRSNILTMRWENIDFRNELIYSPDSKSGQPIQTPFTTQSKEVLEHLRTITDSEWVLPSNKSASGHLEDPKRPWQDLLKRAGIENLRLHDLRRTQGSYQAITGASLHIIGAALGHKSTSATGVYAKLTNVPIRDSMQKANDKMMEYMNLA